MPATLLILLPARNEVEALPHLLAQLRDAILELDVHCSVRVTLMVFDGHSTDGSRQVVQDAGVLLHTVPIGKGRAVKKALADHAGAYDYTVMLDADGSYPPAELVPLVMKLLAGYPVVIGRRARQEEGSMPWGNGNGNKLITWLANLLNAGRGSTPDLCTGMWGWNREVAVWLGEVLTSPHFTVETELFLRLTARGHRMVSIPITYLPRLGYRKINRGDHARIGLYLLRHTLLQRF